MTKVCTSGAKLTFNRVLATDSVPVASPGWNSSFDATVNMPTFVINGDYNVVSGRVSRGITITTPAGGGNTVTGATTRSILGDELHYVYGAGPACAPAGNCSVGAYGFNIAPSTNIVDGLLLDHVEAGSMSETVRTSNWQNTIIQNSSFHDISNDGIDHEDYIYNFTDGPSGNNTVRWTTFFNSPNDGVFFEFGGMKGYYFYRNYIYASAFSLMTTKNSGSNYGPVVIVNNTFVSNTGPCSSNCAFISDNGSTFTNIINQNNVFYYVSNSLPNAGTGGVITNDHDAYNYTTYGGFSAPTGTGNITYNNSTQNPFVNATGGDAHLLSNSTVLHAIGVNLGSPYNVDPDGNVAPSSGAWDDGAYQFPSTATVATPTASPVAGTYTSIQTITLATTTSGATICYRLDGVAPTATTAGTCDSPAITYSAPFTLSTSTTVKAIGTLSGDINSSVLTAAYVIHLTWYVDPVNGGPRTSTAAPSAASCNGLATTAYNSGGAHNQSCPFADARSLWDDWLNFQNPGVWVMNGGDTVIFKNCTSSSPCQIAGSSNSSAGNPCAGIGTTCTPPALPAGTSTSNLTMLEGEHFGSCHTTQQAFNTTSSLYQYQGADPANTSYLWAGAGAFFAFSVQDTQHIGMACIDLSDHSPCGASGGPSCSGTDWASYGIYSGNSTTPTNSDINLTDMKIHGFQSRGILGNIGGQWNVTRVVIQGNSQAGWDFDPGGSQASNGTVTSSYLGIVFNGCAEEYPVVDAIPFGSGACTSQSTGGYGDGVGTPVTGPINWIADHMFAIYNTQDGVDLGHTHGGTETFTNGFFYGNNGGNIKVGPNTAVNVFNNIIVSGCNRMSAAITGMGSGFNSNLSDYCRAGTANGVNSNTNATLVFNSTSSDYARDISCTATACTSTSGTTGITVGQTLIPDTSDYHTYARTVATKTDNSHWTISSAYPTNPSNTYFVIVPTTPASTTVAKIYHNTLVNYSESFDNQVQTAFPQNQVNPNLGAGYVADYRDNVFIGYGDSNYNSGLTPHMWPELGPSLEDYNTCYNYTAATSNCVGAHDLTISPLVTSQPATPISVESALDNYNMALSSSSPAVSAGIALSGQTTDYLGVAWASTPSQGALQFAGSATVATPTATPPAGIYIGAQSVVLASTTSGATICYTTDGSTPTATTAGTCTHGTAYSGAVPVTTSLTIMALATKSGSTNSSVLTAAYTITTNVTIIVGGKTVFSGNIKLQ
jgi:hypothetical protein